MGSIVVLKDECPQATGSVPIVPAWPHSANVNPADCKGHAGQNGISKTGKSIKEKGFFWFTVLEGGEGLDCFFLIRQGWKQAWEKEGLNWRQQSQPHSRRTRFTRLCLQNPHTSLQPPLHPEELRLTL